MLQLMHIPRSSQVLKIYINTHHSCDSFGHVASSWEKNVEYCANDIDGGRCAAPPPTGEQEAP